MKKGLLLDKYGRHYSYKVGFNGLNYTNSVKLFYSKSSAWVEKLKGKLRGKLSGRANGFNVKLGSRKFYLSYSEASGLLQMLLLVNSASKKEILCSYEKKEKK